jgi:FkbM family methyltransferase
MKTYSQNKEQDVILEYFDNTVGTFLSIGENDGETLSNVRALALRGWDGVCLEPDPAPYKKLNSLYKDSENVHCFPYAISNETGRATFYSSGHHLSKKDSGLLSTLKKSELDRWTKEVFTEIEVDVLSWEDFYEVSPYKTFDFISCDAEGLDVEILNQIDVSETSMVCIEWNGVHQNKIRIEKKLDGWKLIHLNGENLIYVKP